MKDFPKPLNIKTCNGPAKAIWEVRILVMPKTESHPFGAQVFGGKPNCFQLTENLFDTTLRYLIQSVKYSLNSGKYKVRSGKVPPENVTSGLKKIRCFKFNNNLH